MDLDLIPLIQSPNFNSRNGNKITHIVIHAMMGFMKGTAATFQDPHKKVSAHYGVGRDASVVRYVADANSAWHVCNANPVCIGIEHEDMWRLEHNPHNYGGCIGAIPWWTGEQLKASADLTATLMLKYNIPIQNVIGHNDPWLKQFGNNHSCPGPLFPWGVYRRLINESLERRCVQAFETLKTTTEAVEPAQPTAKPVNKGGRPRKVPKN